jgi:hypothetical protein
MAPSGPGHDGCHHKVRKFVNTFDIRAPLLWRRHSGVTTRIPAVTMIGVLHRPVATGW